MIKHLFFLFFLLSFFTFSQRPPTKQFKKYFVTGKIIDTDTKQPLEYATIIFKNKRNPSRVQGGITNEQGVFNFEIFAGNYDVTFEFISFESKTQENISIKEKFDFGTIDLAISDNILDEVSVIAEKTEVEISLDKRVYNVGKDLTVRGGSVSDVLDNVPSVSVDVEGNVALRGNNNVQILINGRPSGLTGLAGPQGLRQLPAESIEKVEVITSPSARYDAEGSGGILNIILKKEKLKGFNGSVIANVGYPASYGANIQLNKRTDKFNFFNTTTYNKSQVPGQSYNKTTYTNRENIIEQKRDFNRDRERIFTNLGVEYFITENSSISLNGFYRNTLGINNNETDTNNISGSAVTLIERNENEEEKEDGYQVSLNYINDFNDKGHKLTVDLQLEGNEEVEKGDITELQNTSTTAEEKVITLDNQRRDLVQFDYVNPIDENTTIEAGYRGTFTVLDTDFEVQIKDENNIFKVDSTVTNVLKYEEYVNAAYAQYGRKLDKFSFLLGLRMEHSNIRINTTNQKIYTDWFPTVNLSYELDEKQSFVVGYNRRLRRPRSRFINPFASRSSVTNIFQGNPDLDPSYSNNLDFNYLNRFGKFTLNASAYYQKSTKVFTFITVPTGVDVEIGNGIIVPQLRRTPINIAENNRIGGEITMSYNPSRKVRLNGNVNIFNSKTIGSYENQDLGAEITSWFVRLNSAIKIPGDIDWQTRFFYRGPRRTAIEEAQGIFSFSGALNKNILKNKGTITFSASDIFNTRRRKGTTTTNAFTEYGEFQWRVPTYILSFSYRINQEDRKRSRRRQQRSGGGDGDFEMEG